MQNETNITTETMKKTLMLYSSVDGQTIKIIEKIKQDINGEVDLFDIDTVNQIDFSAYRKVLIGASIRYGKLRPTLIQFVNRYQQQLDQLPNAFFLVCLTARKPEKAVPENNAYMKKFDLISQWKPTIKVVFAGALLYSRYNWWQTLIIQLIMKITGGSTDKSKDIELTDWQKVTLFSQQFNKL